MKMIRTCLAKMFNGVLADNIRLRAKVAELEKENRRLSLNVHTLKHRVYKLAYSQGSNRGS